MAYDSDKKKTSSKVQQLYTKRASLYESLYVNRLGWGKELYTFFTATNYLKSTVKVLDAGCGTGVITRTLYKIAHEKGYEEIEFHAFDLTKSMLDIFQEQITEQGLKNIKLQQADVLKLDSLATDWKLYDLIISSALLEYIPEEHISNALSNLKELLNDEGTLLLFITRSNVITRLTGKLLWKTNLFEEEQIKRILENVGFKKIELRKLTSLWSNYIMVLEVRK